jgi:hypothetical protein
MVYLKSFAAGIVAVVLAALLVLIAAVVYLNLFFKHAEDQAIGWDPISLVRSSPWLSVLALLVFLAGYFWELRRATRPQ